MSPPSQACLDALPNELLLEIIDYVGDSQTSPPHPLWSLSLVNQRLHRFVTPHLYTECSNGRMSGSPALLLRTLVTSLTVAERVKKLSWMQSNETSWRSLKALSEADQEFLASRIRDLGTPFARHLAALFGQATNFDERLLIAFTMFTPNIECLTVTDEWKLDGSRQWIDPIRFGSPHPFGHLKIVRISADKMQFKDVLTFLLLPSMREVHISGVLACYQEDISIVPHRNSETTVYVGPLSATISNVEHLSIIGYIDTRIFPWLLLAFRHLRTLMYNHELYPPWDDGTGRTGLVLDYSQMANLTHHHDSLESLTLRDIQPKYGAQSELPSLKHFKKLKEVDVNFAAIFNLHQTDPSSLLRMLPKSIRKLRLDHHTTIDGPPSNHFLPSLNFLAQHAQAHFPYLKEIELRSGAFAYEQYRDERILLEQRDAEILEELFDGIGVSFTTTRWI